MRVIYFGVLNAGEAGHYVHEPAQPGRHRYAELCRDLGVSHVDAALTPRVKDGKRLGEPQGAAALHWLGGWSVLAWWDRTGDHRYGSNSVLAVEGVHTFDRMLELLRAHFPGVADRQPAPWLA